MYAWFCLLSPFFYKTSNFSLIDEIKQPDPNPGAAASTSSHVTRLTPGEQTVHELTPVMLGKKSQQNIY